MTVVLAIDPGYDRAGLAIVECKENQKERVLFSSCCTTTRTDSFEKRLVQIGSEVERLIKNYRPSAMALEKLYFASNKKTAMGVSGARGMLLYLAGIHHLPVFEYTPLQIKNAVTGNGQSGKKEVEHMVKQLVDIEKKIAYDDEYDAIAIGITCLATERHLQK